MGCKHTWIAKDFKRQCTKCKLKQILVENKYPKIGTPKFEWKVGPQNYPVSNLWQNIKSSVISFFKSNKEGA